MNKIEILKELIGESKSEFIASDLEEVYKDLNEELENINSDIIRAPIWSYDNDEEAIELNKMIQAIKLVYSWYSSKVLK